MPPNQDLEYVLFVETPNYGPIGLLLRDGGKHLGLAGVEELSFYKLMGIEPPPEVKIGDDMLGRVKRVKQDWKIPLHGEWQDIGGVVEQLYSHSIDVDEAVVSHTNFYSRHRYEAAAILGFSGLGSLVAASIAAEVFDMHKVLIYSIEGVILAGISVGWILYFRGLSREEKKEEKIKPIFDSFFKELGTVREGIIRAGVLDGILPQDYGLPK